jgi:hypothetical protein
MSRVARNAGARQTDRRPWPRGTAGVVFLAALFYFLLFHRYGFFLQDEGTIAYQALRVAEGELPYASFQTAYTPAGYYLHALLFQVAGPSFVVLRVAASVACAATAALLFVASATVLPGAYALLPSFLYVVLEDQASQGHVVHTMAYPARYVTTLWAASLCLTLAYTRRRRRWLAALLGLFAAAICSLKHTAGAYNAWAAGLGLILPNLGAGTGRDGAAAAAEAPSEHETQGRRPARAFRVLPLLFLGGILASLPVLFGGFTTSDPLAELVLTLPIALAVLCLCPAAWPWRRAGPADARLARAGRDLLAFGCATVAPTLLWILYFGSRAGFGLIGRRLVFDGPAVARSYAIPYPAPGVAATALLSVAAVVVTARLLGARRGAATARLATAAATLTIGVGALGLLWMGERIRSLIGAGNWLAAVNFAGAQGDSAGFYVIPIVGYAFLPVLASALRHRRPVDAAVLCWVHALCQNLLAYPRLDVAHMYEGTVISLISGTVLLERTRRFLGGAAPWSWRGVRACAAAALAILLAAKLLPRIEAQVAWHGRPTQAPRTTLAGPRGGLYDTKAAWFAALNRTVSFVKAETAPDAPIFAFPALAGVYFLSERHNPTGMDYFHRGFGEGQDEVEVITTLEAKQVPLVVTLDDVSFDPPHLGYFPILKDYLARHFALAESFPPFQVLERRAP